jgi:hypothetical protein
MNRQPYGRLLLAGPNHAMAPVRRDVQIISGNKPPGLDFVFELDLRFARDDQHPFGPFLIVPEARQAGLPGRDDALDFQPRRGEQFKEGFFGRIRVDTGENITIGSIAFHRSSLSPLFYFSQGGST